MYSNDQTQIRAGMVNFIGAMIKSSPFEGRSNKQNIASVLVEETLNIAKDENGILDLYVLKPMIRGMVFTLKQRINELSKLPKNDQVESQKNEYTVIINSFEKLLNIL